MNSYQKLKKKYKQDITNLYRDIYTLIDNKDFYEVEQVKMEYQSRRDLLNSLSYGSNLEFKKP